MYRFFSTFHNNNHHSKQKRHQQFVPSKQLLTRHQKHRKCKRLGFGKQHEKVALLYEKAKEYETQYPRWLKTVIHEESSHYSEMKRQFTLILHTLALYKSDLKAAQNKRPTNQEDLEYLNRKIPKLVDAIYYYCKLAEEERLKKIH